MRYVSLGENDTVFTDGLIGLFDIDNTTVSPITRDFLKKAEAKGCLRSDQGVLPRSCAVYAGKTGMWAVYLSAINTATLKKRILQNTDQVREKYGK